MLVRVHDEPAVRSLRHRIVNDLNLVHGLLSLAQRRLEDNDAQRIFEATRARVRTISLVHQAAWHSASRDAAARVEVAPFLREGAEECVRAAHLGRAPALELELVELSLDFDRSVALGLLTRELVANAAEHAFVGRTPGKISLSLARSEPGELVLRVSDDGVGMPREAVPAQRTALGLTLVKLLAEQLHGRLALGQGDGPGTVAAFSFAA